jgi:hypothetical protein
MILVNMEKNILYQGKWGIFLLYTVCRHQGLRWLFFNLGNFHLTNMFSCIILAFSLDATFQLAFNVSSVL